MQFAGVLPEDAPDPRLEREERLKDMPVPIVVLVPQPSVEFVDFGVSTTGSASGIDAMTVSMSATLWRNPVNKSDPVNLADLDEATRRALDEVPPWPRPAWLVESVERMRYPMLWEAAQTTWHREETERSTLDSLLVQHTNHILMNQFREQLGLGLCSGCKAPRRRHPYRRRSARSPSVSHAGVRAAPPLTPTSRTAPPAGRSAAYRATEGRRGPSNARRD